VGGRGIENLHNSKPHEQQQRNEKWRTKAEGFLAAVGPEEGKVDDQEQKVLGKINGHIVAEIFPGKVLVQEPGKEKIESVTPVVEHRNGDSTSDKSQSDIGQAGEVTRDDIAGGFVSGDGKNDKKSEYENRISADIAGKRQRGIYDATSRTKM
jgi:hypothetical protein